MLHRNFSLKNTEFLIGECIGVVFFVMNFGEFINLVIQKLQRNHWKCPVSERKCCFRTVLWSSVDCFPRGPLSCRASLLLCFKQSSQLQHVSGTRPPSLSPYQSPITSTVFLTVQPPPPKPRLSRPIRASGGTPPLAADWSVFDVWPMASLVGSLRIGSPIRTRFEK